MLQHVSAVFGSVFTEGERTAGRAGVECLESFFELFTPLADGGEEALRVIIAAVFFDTVHLRVMQRDGEERFINNPTSTIESWSNFIFSFLLPPLSPRPWQLSAADFKLCKIVHRQNIIGGKKRRSKKEAHKEKAK